MDVHEPSALANSLEVSPPMTVPSAERDDRNLWSGGPPGIALYVGTAVAILMALDANSIGSLTNSRVALAVSAFVVGIWLLRFVVSA
jgi:hypothetical protein